VVEMSPESTDRNLGQKGYGWGFRGEFPGSLRVHTDRFSQGLAPVSSLRRPAQHARLMKQLPHGGQVMLLLT